MSGWREAALALLAAATVAGCKEQLTTAGKCPSLCPGPHVQMVDTLLTDAVVTDTSVRGYVGIREASYLLASTEDTLRSVVLVRFTSMLGDTVWTIGNDTPKVGRQDSVLLSMSVLQRDTAVKQLKLVVYRLPAKFDTATTYAQIAPYFTDSELVDTVAVPDTLASGALVLRIADSLNVRALDSGIVSLGVALVAPAKTALTFDPGRATASSAPLLAMYVHARAPLDTLTHVFSSSPFVSLFVMNPPPGQPPPRVLAVGGIPTSRATLRLNLPKAVVDSNAVVRATLLLNSLAPAGGFARDSFYVVAEPVVRDFGVKSVLWPDSAVSGQVHLAQGQSGPVAIDIAPILRFWGTTQGDSAPRLLVLRVYPEGSTLGSATFAGHAAGAAGPQLEVTYVKKYTFGLP